MSSFNGIIDRIDDHMNPIIVKELRQIVRGRFFWGVLILFLTIQCLILSLAIAGRGMTNNSVGEDTLTFLFAILFLATYVLIPLNTGFRFARERSDGSDELLYITTITPNSIIWGKFAASMAVTLLLFSAFAPFSAMTFFLRGVDFNVTFFLLLGGLTICAGGTILQICLGALARDAHTMQLFRVAGFGFQILSFFTLNAISSEMIRYGSSRYYGIPNYLETIGSFGLVFAGICCFLFFSAAAAISPTGSNRMFAVRRCLTKLWLVTLMLAGYWAAVASSTEIFLIWGYMFITFLGIFTLVAVSERDFLTERVAREIPQGSLKGWLAFMFYSGAAGGLLWNLVIQLLTVLIVSIFMQQFFPITTFGSSQYNDFFLFSMGFMAYSFGYALLSTFVRRTFLAAYIGSRNTWVVGLMACALLSIAPIVMGSMLGFSSDTFMIGNPLSLIQRGEKDMGLIFSMVLMLVTLLINLPWLTRQLGQFRAIWSKRTETLAKEL